MSHVMNTYARQPVAFVRGEGVWLWDEAGKKYLDALAAHEGDRLAGVGVHHVGHRSFLQNAKRRPGPPFCESYHRLSG